MSPDMTVAIMGDDLDTIWIYYCRGGGGAGCRERLFCRVLEGYRHM